MKVPVILCLLFFSVFNSAFGLFSSELFYAKTAYTEALGGVYFIEASKDWENKHSHFQFDTSYISQLMMRDMFTLKGVLYPVDVALDMLFIPGFDEIDDTGTVQTIFPFALTARVQGYIIRNPVFTFRLGGFIGAESVGSFGGHPAFGLHALVSWTFTPGVTFGITGGGNDMNVTLVQAGFEFDLVYLKLYPSFDLNGINKSVKLGASVPITPDFTALGGCTYSLDYNGWNFNVGLDLTEVPLFGLSSRIGTAFSYNLAAGVTFQLSLGLALGA
ncbi:MAG: hypothetical protein A2Y33_11865 [Spirochaetes bacterium GWF1_51_8]|nr:MAG: hypothetical protein A2Y33_11865 [Spirochaetes bacterium GWF1_51_8]